MSAFTEALQTFAAQNIPVIPTAADRPSRPMVRHPDKFCVKACLRLAEKPRFQNANAGLWTGKGSGLTIIDVDSTDPAIVAEAIKIFGDTPLKVGTPSGVHCYYRHGGEDRRIRPFGKDLPLDVLGGGLAVLPPSMRPQTEKKAAGAYRVIEGDIDALQALPLLRSGSIPAFKGVVQHPGRVRDENWRGMREGDGRDNKLFAFACQAAVKARTEYELRKAVQAKNAEMAEPLSDAVAIQKAAGAWRYKLDGKLMVAGTRSALMDSGTIEVCRGRASAFFQLAFLRSHHSSDHMFAIVPEALAAVLGFSANTIRKDRDWLVEKGLLTLVRKGGGYTGTGGITSVYSLGNQGGTTLQNLKGIELDTRPRLLPLPSVEGGVHD